MGIDGWAAVYVETAVMPGEHVFDNGFVDLAFGFEHFKDFITEQVFQIFGVWTFTHLKYSVI